MTLARHPLQGLWSADLTADDVATGIGVLVFRPLRASQEFYEEGSVRGGDRHYVYVGEYSVENGHVIGHVVVRRYDVHEPEPVLFGAERTRLDFSGPMDARRDVLSFEVNFGASPPPRAAAGATRLRLTRREER